MVPEAAAAPSAKPEHEKDANDPRKPNSKEWRLRQHTANMYSHGTLQNDCRHSTGQKNTGRGLWLLQDLRPASLTPDNHAVVSCSNINPFHPSSSPTLFQVHGIQVEIDYIRFCCSYLLRLFLSWREHHSSNAMSLVSEYVFPEYVMTP